MISRRRYMGGGGLPYDAEIEYIESTGTQYIDTGVLVNTEWLGYEYGVVLSNKTGTETFAGVWETAFNNSNLCCVVIGNYKMKRLSVTKNWRGGDTNLLGDYTLFGSRVDISWINNHDDNGTSYTMTCKVNGSVYDTYTFDNPIRKTTNYTIPIFCCKSPQDQIKENSIARLFYFRIMKYDEPIFDGIPVRVGQVGYLYDKVSGQLFGNLGTGDFILGNDKN